MAARLPPLSALRAFEATARLGSVSAAAAELGRTHGAVSKQLRALQAESGIALFYKAGTGLKPSAAGQRLAAAVGAAFARLGEAYDALIGETRAPGVHVACSASFAMSWLVPNLPHFSALYPDIRIRLSMTSAREMRNEREADLAILWDRAAYPPADRARAIRLADCAFGVIAAPGYPVTRTETGLFAPCRILHEHTGRAWEAWTAATGLTVEVASALSFPHTHLCVGAAAAGMGIAIAERRLAAAGLSGGALALIGPLAAFDDGFAAIANGARPMSVPTRRFIDWLGPALQAA